MTLLTIADLDAIEARAKAAVNEEWFVVDGLEIRFSEGDIADTGASTCSLREDHTNAAHIAGMDPPTTLALVALARKGNEFMSAEQRESDAAFDALHIEAMTREWFAGPNPTVDGYLQVLRKRLARRALPPPAPSGLRTGHTGAGG